MEKAQKTKRNWNPRKRIPGSEGPIQAAPRHRNINLHATEEEYDRLEREAALTGMRVSIYCRAMALGERTWEGNRLLYRLLERMSSIGRDLSATASRLDVMSLSWDEPLCGKLLEEQVRLMGSLSRLMSEMDHLCSIETTLRHLQLMMVYGKDSPKEIADVLRTLLPDESDTSP